jgi:type IV pilus assembly protein PilA
MNKKLNAGFTLIELLVVIAIIGILSSVVLASLNTARSKGSDAAIRSNLNGIRSQAEILYDTVGNYSTVCADATVDRATKAANTAFGSVVASVNNTFATAGAANTVTCHNDNAGWAIEAPLKQGGFFCIDKSGVSTSTAATSLAASDTTCG